MIMTALLHAGRGRGRAAAGQQPSHVLRSCWYEGCMADLLHPQGILTISGHMMSRVILEKADGRPMPFSYQQKALLEP